MAELGPSPPLPTSLPVESRPPAWVGLALQQPSLGRACSVCSPDGETPQGKLPRAPAPPPPALWLTERTGFLRSETNHLVA